MAYINGNEILFSPIIGSVSDKDINLQEKSVEPVAGVETSVTPDPWFDGLSKVVINAKIPEGYVVPNLQEKSVAPTVGKGTPVVPDAGYDGLSKVTVSAIELQEKSIEITGGEQKSVQPDAEHHGLSKVTITAKIPDGYKIPVTQEKSVEITGGEQKSVQPDSGVDGLSKVTITAKIPDGYLLPNGTKTVKKADRLGAIPVVEYASVSIPLVKYTGTSKKTHKLINEFGNIDRNISVKTPDDCYAIDEVEIEIDTDGIIATPTGTKNITGDDIGTYVEVVHSARVYVNIPKYSGSVGNVTPI